jgi:hypothetical protein
MDLFFLVNILVVAVLLVAVIGGALYIYGAKRRGVAEAGDSAVAGAARPSPPPQDPPREFFMSVSQERDRQMRVRLYPLEEYGTGLGGDADEARRSGFRAALKAQLALDDEWYDYPPEKAAQVLGLAPSDYEVDADKGALLLRRLPHGLPEAARDDL